MKISIVTPSFRNSDWLRLCVASVADQAGVEVEHIVQDAQSDDGTQEWLARDRRVQAYFEKDQGMYDAITEGGGGQPARFWPTSTATSNTCRGGCAPSKSSSAGIRCRRADTPHDA